MPLDAYDELPKDMRAYLSHYGWHFGKKKACEYAVYDEEGKPSNKEA